jgi:hypothetical protein
MKMNPLPPMEIPTRQPNTKVEKIVINERQKESEFFMNTDKLTTFAGGVAVVCTGIIGAGVLVPASALYVAVVAIGTISGGIFAWFTNKPNPFEKK